MAGKGSRGLRRGWTTGACAAAAARAAYLGLVRGQFPDPVAIALPRGGTAEFSPALAEPGQDRARAGVGKDAGDDLDVTDGALVIAEVAPTAPGGGGFAAGEGVGTVTRAGLPLAVGEPATNPAPRAMIRAALGAAAAELGLPPPDATVTVSTPGGARLAEKTMNARLGIVGGLSILGTTGVVIPYSCAAWVHVIERGIDVARAAGLEHIAAATGGVSERAVQPLYGLPDQALIDMGDFVGGLLKYLRRHPLPRLTIAGGFAKLAKLAQGHRDLHSAKRRVDSARLARLLAELGADPAIRARAEAAAGAAEILELAGGMGAALAEAIAAAARRVALASLAGETAVEVAVVGRDGTFLARGGP
jgi:cobalt-precorrin-5B (C1)-methyltransferase